MQLKTPGCYGCLIVQQGTGASFIYCRPVGGAAKSTYGSTQWAESVAHNG